MFKKAFFIGFTVLLLVNCHNKLEILAPYKESVAVYGLLNQTDTVQYIRVERVFLGEGNALIMAQNQDSVYFKPGDLKVSLLRYKNGARVSVDNPASSVMEIILTEAYLQTQPGVFNSTQLLYKTNHPLYEDSRYKLVIHSNKTGKNFSSKDSVGLIGDFKSHLTYGASPNNSILLANQSSGQISAVNIVPKGTVSCKYGSPLNSAVCGLVVRFFYTEFPNSGAPVQKYIDIDKGIDYVTNTDGSQFVDLSFSGDGMIHNIANSISVDPVINHRTADSVQFLLTAAGFDISLYNQVSTTSTLSQERPTYTNIADGIGVFSSRRQYSLVKKLDGQYCLARLSSDPITCPLRFYDVTGSLSTACP